MLCAEQTTSYHRVAGFLINKLNNKNKTMGTIQITKNDYKKITELLGKKYPHDDHDKALLAELARAHIVDPEAVSPDVITMNSLVKFSDIHSNESLEYWLVFPQDADISKNKISVLSPIGCALLGCRIGDHITLTTPNGKKELRVEHILHQPEASGNYDE